MIAVQCPNCSHDTYTVLSRKLAQGVEGTVVLCRHCGMGYQNPRQSPEELSDFYESDTFFQHSYDSGSEPHPSYFEVGVNRGKSIEKWLKDRSIHPGRILDIGSSYGAILNHLGRGFGADTTGVEPAPGPAAYATSRFGLDIKVSLFSAQMFDGAEFDLITMMHVLEHVPDPVSFLRDVRETVADGGLLVVEVPNMGKRDDLRGLSTHFFSLPHLQYFTRITLTSVLRQAGWQAVHVDDAHNLRIYAEPADASTDYLRDNPLRIRLYLAQYGLRSAMHQTRLRAVDNFKRVVRRVGVLLVGENRVRDLTDRLLK